MAGTIKVQVLKDEGNKRILKCREGNRIWYQIWITQMDMNCIERYFDGCSEVKRWWLRDLQIWYFMRRKVVRLGESLVGIGLRIY